MHALINTKCVVIAGVYQKNYDFVSKTKIKDTPFSSVDTFPIISQLAFREYRDWYVIIRK